MPTAASCPSAVRRHLVAAMAGLVLLVHGALEPAHLVSHHGSDEEQAHLAAHQGEHADHQHHAGGGPVDHSDEHDGGDHGGTGHLLEVVPHPGPAAGLKLGMSCAVQPGEAPTLLASTWKSLDAAIHEHQPRPPPRGPAPSRAPPIG